MSDETKHYNEIDDYIAALTPDEQKDLSAAEAALDLAYLLHRAREERGLTQAAAAAQTGLHQQAISRLERSLRNVQLDTLQRYLDALGYTIDIEVKDKQTGQVLGTATLSSA